jgi:LacI family transcriptional regulator, gluconate utilization system Gnt-I transcriptional repressor
LKARDAEERVDSLQRRRRKAQRVTLSDVAAFANVSPSTVSLYLRKPEAVSAERARRVVDAVETLGYVPNLMAGGLAAASSRIVSVIVPSIRNAFFAETVTTIQTALSSKGLQVLLGHTEYSEAQEEALVRAALSWAPAAIVLTGLNHSSGVRALLADSQVPVVEMWELGGPVINMAVGFSHEAAGAAAAQQLLDRGRRNILYVGARLHEDRRAARRADGCLRELESAGLGGDRIVNHPGPASVDAGALLLGRVLRQAPDVDALVCSNDLVALGILFEAQRRSIAVPERLSVVGFGDLDFSASCNPPLTSIRPYGDLIGLEVSRLILQNLEGSPPPLGTTVDTNFLLIERRST